MRDYSNDENLKTVRNGTYNDCSAAVEFKILYKLMSIRFLSSISTMADEIIREIKHEILMKHEIALPEAEGKEV